MAPGLHMGLPMLHLCISAAPLVVNGACQSPRSPSTVLSSFGVISPCPLLTYHSCHVLVCPIPTVVEEEVGAVLIPAEDVRSTVTQDGAYSHTTAPWGQQPVVRLSPALGAACPCICSSVPKTPSSPSLLLQLPLIKS